MLPFQCQANLTQPSRCRLAGNQLASAEGLAGLRACTRLAKLDLARNRLEALDALPGELEAPLRSLCLVGNPLVPALRCALHQRSPAPLLPTTLLPLADRCQRCSACCAPSKSP